MARTVGFRQLGMAVALGAVSFCEHVVAGQPVTAREQLNAVLWMQTADEYRMATSQTYRTATSALEQVRKQDCASWEQHKESPGSCKNKRLRPAIVLDIDETVLNNSYFQSRLIRDGQDYVDADWDRWVSEKKATEITGAAAFVKAAVHMGFEVFFVTNRGCQRHGARVGLVDRYYDSTGRALICPQKAETLQRLAELGFPLLSEDHYLFGDEFFDRADATAAAGVEKKSWETRKDRRRRFIFEHYPVRIVMLVGDDLRDFVERDVWAANVATLTPLVGTQWFILPNPAYGSWEIAAGGTGCRDAKLLNPSEACAAVKLQKKYELLNDARQ